MDRIPSQSIELLLDADAEARLREDWRRLQDAGLSSLGAHSAPSNAPHVTLAVGERLDPPPAALWTALPLPLRFGGLLLFGVGERRVLARAIVPGAELLALHARLHEGIVAAEPLTRPGAWTPHVSLARRIRVTQLPQALAALEEAAEEPVEPASARPIGEDALLVAARHWDPVTRTVADL